MSYPVGGHWAARVVTPGDDDDVLTVAELKERARILDGDDETDVLLKGYISAAREQVEHDTGLALPTQTIAVTFDTPAPGGVLRLPRPPCQAVATITYLDETGTVVDLDPDVAIQLLDTVSMPARLVWVAGVFASPLVPAPIASLSLTLTVGWAKAALPPSLKFAVGLLASHFLTAGRDLTVIGTSVLDMPYGYEDAIAPWRLVEVA